MLMTGTENFGVRGRYDVDGKIIRADDANLFAGKPARAFESYPRRPVVEGSRLAGPARTVPRPHESRVAGSDDLLRQILTLQAGIEINQLDFLADIEDATFLSLHVE